MFHCFVHIFDCKKNGCMATTWQSINILNFFYLKKKKILTSSKVECVIPVHFPTYPTYLNTSFYFAVDQLLSLSLSLWRSPASYSPWVSFPLLSTTSMVTTTSHHDGSPNLLSHFSYSILYSTNKNLPRVHLIN